MAAFTSPISLEPGELMQVGDQILGCCYDCGELVRVDKPLLGSLHLCVTDEEAAQQPWRRRGSAS